MFNYVVLLAAGRGQRMDELTIDSPKALIDVDGKPLISYSLIQINQKIKHIFITVGYHKQKMIKYFAENKKCQIIDTSHKGNSWWIFNSPLKYVNEPVLVLACDILTTIDIPLIFSNYIRIGSPPCMMVPVQPVSGIDGDYIEENNNKVLSLSSTRYSPIYGSGIQIINPFIINKNCNEHDDFNQLWLELICNEMLYVSSLYSHSWFSINTREQLERYLKK